MRVVVVGAGLSGLVAATELQAVGCEVVLLDKGRVPGGRLATRRIGSAVVDHGAQFWTVRTAAFRERVDDWTARGIAAVWSHGFGHGDSHPRFIAPAGINALARDLAADVDVRCWSTVVAVRPGTQRWQVLQDDGTAQCADRVVVTAPLPQARALLADAAVELDDQLLGTEYDRTLALLATLDRAPRVRPPGGEQRPTDDVAFVTDNVAKGVSATPAITVHASAAWSEAHWDRETPELVPLMCELARPWLGEAAVDQAQVHKWRYATPRTSWPEPCWVSADGDLVLAGDAFDGPRIEAAHNSGLAAARAVLR